MLRFSKKADYAILLLSYLAQAAADAGFGKRARADLHSADQADSLDAGTENPGQALSSAQDLANATGLSPSLTANILKDFARRGILTSVRGASGGYRLDRDPKDLSLREILEVVDGPLHLVDCSDHGESEHGEPTGKRARNDATPKGMVGADNSGHADSGASGCCHVDICPSRRPLLALQERIFDMLETLPLQDLISQQRARAAGPSACATSTVLPHNV
mgnify:CR=1 FL=1